MNPLVSVIVPNYNHSKYLDQRINSILNQSYKNFEIILLDDNSSDSSLEILESYKRHNKVSKLILNKENSGSPFGMWEKGFNAAKGELIWIAESDDFSSELFLASLVKSFIDPTVVISHCRSFNYYEGKDNSVLELNKWWDSFNSERWDFDYIEEGKILLKEYGAFKCPVINVSSSIFRKSILKFISIPFNFRYCGDWIFWASIFTLGKVSYVKEPLNYIRIHSNSATFRNELTFNLKLIENTNIARNISSLIEIQFKYSVKYDWLVSDWCYAIYNNPVKFSIQSISLLNLTFHKVIFLYFINILKSKILNFKF